jgi:hypothetical protein
MQFKMDQNDNSLCFQYEGKIGTLASMLSAMVDQVKSRLESVDLSEFPEADCEDVKFVCNVLLTKKETPKAVKAKPKRK